MYIYSGSVFEPMLIVICRAGGGGNTKDRRAKIEGKNQKLNEERLRRIQEEEKAKLTKASEGGKTIDESAIHPSRRGRVPVV